MACAAEQPLLMNGDEDPYKSEGHIELRIENLTRFVREENETRSYPVYVRGIPWKIFAIRQGYYYLEYNGSAEDISCKYEYDVIGTLKIVAQKEGSVDHVFEAKGTGFDSQDLVWLYLGDMAFEELMNPDRGLYDAQADSITLAVDFTVNSYDKGVGDFVVVAQNELTLDRVPTSISMQIGHLEWQINYDFTDQNNEEERKSLVLSCKDVANGRAERGLLELFGYQQLDNDDSSKLEMIYSPAKDGEALHLFTREDNLLTVSVPSRCKKLLLTARAWKERIHFPDFTKPTAVVGRFSADVKLRVGNQQFHVNRQLLSMHSLFFDRMFHGLYPDAAREEVELSLNTHSPELFHHFLLVMCISEALPNSMNVSALFKLADFYDAENVHKKCDKHLRKAREMPIEKRVLLARDHCTKETQALIVDSVNLEQSKRIINNLFMQNR